MYHRSGDAPRRCIKIALFYDILATPLTTGVAQALALEGDDMFGGASASGAVGSTAAPWEEGAEDKSEQNTAVKIEPNADEQPPPDAKEDAVPEKESGPSAEEEDESWDKSRSF